MNKINPWLVEALIEYERDRIRRDMKRIRLEEEAIQAGRTEQKITKPRLSRSRLLTLIVCALAKLRPLQVYIQKTSSYNGNTGPCRG